MGTGIVSIDLSLDGHETISRVLLILAAVIWVSACRAPPGARRARPRALSRRRAHPRRADLRRRHGRARHTAHRARLGLGRRRTARDRARPVGLALLAPVLRHWVTPTVGASLVLTVSTESLAVLAATLAAREDAPWLLYASAAPFLLGLAFYAFAIRRFDVRQLAVGRGDHWITGGALAISTLAAGRITLAAREPSHALGHHRDAQGRSRSRCGR